MERTRLYQGSSFCAFTRPSGSTKVILFRAPSPSLSLSFVRRVCFESARNFGVSAACCVFACKREHVEQQSLCRSFSLLSPLHSSFPASRQSFVPLCLRTSMGLYFKFETTTTTRFNDVRSASQYQVMR